MEKRKKLLLFHGEEATIPVRLYLDSVTVGTGPLLPLHENYSIQTGLLEVTVSEPHAELLG